MSEQRILAIDPGPTESAWALWNGERVLAHAKVRNRDLIGHLRGPSLSMVPLGALPTLYVEMIASYGMPVGREVFETCVWIGQFVEAYREATGMEPALMTRLSVKQHLCHDSRAKDANIRQALIDRLGAPGTKKQPGATYGIHGDEWAALALAVTAWDLTCGRQEGSDAA